MCASLTRSGSAASAYQSLSAHLALREAQKRGLQRLLQALFREKLLLSEHLIVEGAIAWLPLWSQQGVLRFEGLRVGRMGNCEIGGLVAYYRHGHPPQPLASAAELLACVANALPFPVAAEDLQRLLRELDNSLDNDVLCLQYRQGWAQELAGQFGNQSEYFVASVRQSTLDNPVLLLEQWGTLGHPWHPTHKTKLGLTANDVLGMSPEFEATLQVTVAALRCDKAHVTLHAVPDDYCSWFAATFSTTYQRWGHALRQRGEVPQKWLPLPLHPFQAERILPECFAAEIARGELLLLPEISFPASPTMSFRTVVPEGAATLPHVKLPVSLRLTSVERTVSPKSTVMGPRLSRLLSTIVDKEHGFDGTLDIVPELAGVHYLDPHNNDDRARHLSVLYRANPMAKSSKQLFPIPVGALFADSPLNKRPIVTDLVALSCGDHAGGAQQFFTHYATTVVNATLSTYLLYGIAFEAHQQNSFIQVDERYAPVQLLVRDFGDVRVHGPTLERAGLNIVPYRKSHTVYTENAPVRDKLLHAVMLCHLVELGLLLARTYNTADNVLWNILRCAVEQRFDTLRSRTHPPRWEEERAALLEHDWPAKSFLRMRLANTSDDVHGNMPNPLTSWVA